MRSLSILGFLLFFLGCSGTNNHLKVIPVDNRLNEGQNSCSGRGVISSTGNFSGKLSFSLTAKSSVRDRYYSQVFSWVQKEISKKSSMSGVNFWAWSGEGRPREEASDF